MWSSKKIYINDTFQISMGKLVFVLFITLFQFFGMWVENNWIIVPAMFYLFSNAFLAIEKSNKKVEEERQKLIAEKDNLFDRNTLLFANNESIISILENEIRESKTLITELRNEVKGLKCEVVELKQQVKDLEIQLKNK